MLFELIQFQKSWLVILGLENVCAIILPVLLECKSFGVFKVFAPEIIYECRIENHKGGIWFMLFDKGFGPMHTACRVGFDKLVCLEIAVQIRLKHRYSLFVLLLIIHQTCFLDFIEYYFRIIAITNIDIILIVFFVP